jgi:hypothetical protein
MNSIHPVFNRLASFHSPRARKQCTLLRVTSRRLAIDALFRDFYRSVADVALASPVKHNCEYLGKTGVQQGFPRDPKFAEFCVTGFQQAFLTAC